MKFGKTHLVCLPAVLASILLASHSLRAVVESGRCRGEATEAAAVLKEAAHWTAAAEAEREVTAGVNMALP